MPLEDLTALEQQSRCDEPGEVRGSDRSDESALEVSMGRYSAKDIKLGKTKKKSKYRKMARNNDVSALEESSAD